MNTTETRSKRLIVSMASHPGRISTTAYAIASLLNQTLKPDKIILWLGEDKFPDKKLPAILKKVEACGVEIRFCEDLGPHKKYFFTMQEYPEDLVLTFDDDVIYNSDVIEKLYSSYLAHPECISGIRVHKITFSQSDRSIRKYTDWELECIGCEGDESHKYLITSVAGDIYPPHSVHEEAFNVEALKNLCPMNDDIWLKVMEVMKGTKLVPASNIGKIPGRTIFRSQDMALWKSNVIQGENDAQIKAVFDAYSWWRDSEGRSLLDIIREG